MNLKLKVMLNNQQLLLFQHEKHQAAVRVMNTTAQEFLKQTPILSTWHVSKSQTVVSLLVILVPSDDRELLLQLNILQLMDVE